MTPRTPIVRIPAMIWSTDRVRPARIIIAPMPSSAPTISAITRYVHPTAIILRIESKIAGAAAGTTIFRTTSRRLAPMVRAASTNSPGTASVLSRMSAVRKKTTPMKSSASLAVSVGPNQTSSKGIKEAAGKYLQPERVGLRSARRLPKHPISTPNGMATAAAAKKLTKIRMQLAMTSARKSCSRKRSTSAYRTSSTEGKNLRPSSGVR